MFEPPRWSPLSILPIAAGLAWLWCAASFGVVGFLFSVIPGCLLLSSGMATLLFPGDARIPHFAALGGLLGVPLAFPAFFVAGFGTGAVLVLLSAVSFVAAGAISVHQDPHVEDVPAPEPSVSLASQVAVDDVLLATMHLSLPLPRRGEQRRIRDEVHEALELFRDSGWLEKPADYHPAPPPLESPLLIRRHSRGVAFEHLSFASGYEPRPEEPGRERWMALERNHTAHAWVLRHQAPERPWLVCINGYQMGMPLVDLQAFRAARLHHKLGLNLVIPVLPLHGPRKCGRRSGDGFLAGDILDTTHAEAQAMWDLRRLLSWIRGQGGTRIGVHGLSLGGYNAALLACLEELECAIPGIPLADTTRALWRHGPALHIRHAERTGLVHDAVCEVTSVVSPLVLEPKVPKPGRYIFGAVADRLVPADHVRDLWRHWDRPRIVWYQGGHVTFRLHREAAGLLEEGLRETGFVASPT